MSLVLVPFERRERRRSDRTGTGPDQGKFEKKAKTDLSPRTSSSRLQGWTFPGAPVNGGGTFDPPDAAYGVTLPSPASGSQVRDSDDAARPPRAAT